MPRSHATSRRRLLVGASLFTALLLVLGWPHHAQDVSAQQPVADLVTGTGGFESQATALGVLEVPTHGSNQSGIGVITGWVCDAERITLLVDGHEREAAYGTRRNDTQAVCGDTDNGFGYLINWNVLGDGPHRIEAWADGALLGASDITVHTLGEPFKRGLAGTYTLKGFPGPGASTKVQWVESAQGFRIVAPSERAAAAIEADGQAAALGVLENPTDGPVSGIGVVSGWICDAEEILVYVDGTPRLVAAYGTSRSDTAAACGDTDNGFGVLINWNLLGDGTHVVRVEADGELVGESTIVVQTLGAPFVQGLSGTFGLGLFGGRNVELEWQEAQQNFVITTASTAPTAAPSPAPTLLPPLSPTPGIDDPTPTPRPTIRPTPTPTPRVTPTRTPTPRPTVKATPRPTQRACCKICTSGKACGDSCISRSKSCHVGGGCACNG